MAEVVEVPEGICDYCYKPLVDCKGTRRYLAETCHGVEEVVEYCDGVIERC